MTILAVSEFAPAIVILTLLLVVPLVLVAAIASLRATSRWTGVIELKAALAQEPMDRLREMVAASGSAGVLPATGSVIAGPSAPAPPDPFDYDEEAVMAGAVSSVPDGMRSTASSSMVQDWGASLMGGSDPLGDPDDGNSPFEDAQNMDKAGEGEAR